MKIDRVVVSCLESNCYILEKDNKVLVVDPGGYTKKIVEVIGNREVLKVLVTHQHIDHIGSVCDIMDIYKVGKLDNSSLDEKEYQVGPFKFKAIFNPGHSPCSVSYYFEDEKVMFVGDFVFKGTVGRCDLEGGDYNQMKESIKKLKTYPKDTILYPGHGDETTLEEEIKYNPYF